MSRAAGQPFPGNLDRLVSGELLETIPADLDGLVSADLFHPALLENDALVVDVWPAGVISPKFVTSFAVSTMRRQIPRSDSTPRLSVAQGLRPELKS
jgi:hypothetical protein